MDRLIALARRICDATPFRVGVALLFGLPVLALGATSAVISAGAMLSAVLRITDGTLSPDEVAPLVAILFMTGAAACAVIGIVLRLLVSSTRLDRAPRLRRALQLVLVLPVAVFGVMALLVPNPLSVLFAVVGAICLAGSCALPATTQPAVSPGSTET